MAEQLSGLGCTPHGSLCQSPECCKSELSSRRPAGSHASDAGCRIPKLAARELQQPGITIFDVPMRQNAIIRNHLPPSGGRRRHRQTAAVTKTLSRAISPSASAITWQRWIFWGTLELLWRAAGRIGHLPRRECRELIRHQRIVGALRMAQQNAVRSGEYGRDSHCTIGLEVSVSCSREDTLLTACPGNLQVHCAPDRQLPKRQQLLHMVLRQCCQQRPSSSSSPVCLCW